MAMIRRVLNKIKIYRHDLYVLKYDEILPFENNRLKPFPITEESFGMVRMTKALRKMLLEQKEYVEGYGFKDSNGRVVGHLYLMKRGGNEVMYKIRNIDAYLFAVRVYDEFRGRRYAEEMIGWLAEKEKREGISEIYLAVKKTNASAIKAYERIGFHKIGSRTFIRIWRVNIPYYSL